MAVGAGAITAIFVGGSLAGLEVPVGLTSGVVIGCSGTGAGVPAMVALGAEVPVAMGARVAVGITTEVLVGAGIALLAGMATVAVLLVGCAIAVAGAAAVLVGCSIGGAGAAVPVATALEVSVGMTAIVPVGCSALAPGEPVAAGVDVSAGGAIAGAL